MSGTLAAELEAIVSGGPYSRAVWDFDGVIADSEPLHSSVYETILKRHGATPEPGFFRDYIGQTDIQIWTAFRERYRIDEDVLSLRQERIDAYLERALSELTPNWFTKPLLDVFDGAGASQYVVSSGDKRVVNALLDRWGFRDYFDQIFAAEPGGGGAYSKLEALRSSIQSAPGRVIVLEDHKRYLAEAFALGATTVAISHSLNDIPSDLAAFVLRGGAHSA